MGWVYEIKIPEAFTLSRYFFAIIKVITFEGYSYLTVKLTQQTITMIASDNNHPALKTYRQYNI